MVALVRLVVMAAVVLSVAYVCLWFFARSGETQRLRALWAEEQPPLPEEAFVRDGLERYEPGLRRRLVWSVYVLPISALVIFIYVTNFL